MTAVAVVDWEPPAGIDAGVRLADFALAERLFGLTVQVVRPEWYGHPVAVWSGGAGPAYCWDPRYAASLNAPDGLPLLSLPHWSGEIEAAFQVEAAMAQRGLYLFLQRRPDGPGDHFVARYLGHTRFGGTVPLGPVHLDHGEHRDPAVAIAQATLGTLGVWLPQAFWRRLP